MSAFHRLGMRHQLASVIVLVGAVGITGLTALQVINHGDRAMTDARVELREAADGAVAQISGYFTGAAREVETNGADPRIAAALGEFSEAYRALGPGAMPALQAAWIDRNSHPIGQKQAQIDSGQGTAYDRAHVAYHRTFEGIQRRGGFYDVFLIDRDFNLVYSYYKERDFAAPLGRGDLAGSGLAEAARAALETGGTVMTRFAPYAPSAGADAAFLAHPVRDGQGTVQGVIAVQIALERMSQALELARDSHVAGLYLIAAMGEVRAWAVAEGTWTPDAGTDAGFLVATPNAEAVRAQAPDGTSLLVTGLPVEVFGVPLQIAATFDYDSLAAELRNAAMLSSIMGLATVAGLAVVAVLFGGRVARPLHNVMELIERLQKGDVSFDVPGKDRGDEIGALSRAVDQFRAQEAASADLRQRQIALAAACDSVSAALLMVDRNMNICFVNNAAVGLMTRRIVDFGQIDRDFDPNKLVGRRIDIFLRGLEAERIQALLENPSPMPKNAEIRIGRALLQLKVSHIPGGDGGLVIEWIDVTDTVIESRLVETSNTNQLIVELGPEWSVVGMNAKFTELTGHSFRRSPPMAVASVLDAYDLGLGGLDEVLRKLVSDNELAGRFGIQTADGSRLLTQGSLTLVRDSEGRPFRIMYVARDITAEEQSRTEIAAERARAQKEQELVVDSLKRGLSGLSDGDLTAVIVEEFPGTYEQIRLDFNRTAANLARAVQGVAENAAQILSESSSISTASDSLAQRTEKQASTLEETAAALDEITKSVGTSSERAGRADRLVSTALRDAASGSKVVLETVEAMGSIEDSSKQISRITSVIDDIAFQTNLLALNAGVEAARAGDAGRGFAVVASEVRALAQRSSAAAREISQLIAESGGHVSRGVDLSGQAGQALKQIEKSFADIATEVTEIASSSLQQSSSLAEINGAMTQLDQVTQQNAAMFEETSAASHALRQESQSLLKLMEQFRTGPEVVFDTTGGARTPKPTDGVPVNTGQVKTPTPVFASRSGAVRRHMTDAERPPAHLLLGDRAGNETSSGFLQSTSAALALDPVHSMATPAGALDGWEDF